MKPTENKEEKAVKEEGQVSPYAPGPAQGAPALSTCPWCCRKDPGSEKGREKNLTWVTTLHSCYQINGRPQISLPRENMQLSEHL